LDGKRFFWNRYYYRHFGRGRYFRSGKIGVTKKELSDFVHFLNRKIKDRYSKRKKAKKIFYYTHKKLLKKYKPNAEFKDFFPKGYYNCLTGSLFYYYLASLYEIPVKLIAAPYHIYCIAALDKAIPIEITMPAEGFSLNEYRKEYLDGMYKYKIITADELAEFKSKPFILKYGDKQKEISKEELIGYQYLNQAYANFLDNDFNAYLNNIEKAFCIIEIEDSHLLAYKMSLSLLNTDKKIKNLPESVNRFKNAFLILNKDQARSVIDIFAFIISSHLAEPSDYLTLEKNVKEIYAYLPLDSIITRKYNEILCDVYYESAIAYYNQGKHKESFHKISLARDLDSSNIKIKTLHINSATRYAERLLKIGDETQATRLMKMLIDKYPDYPIVVEQYIDMKLGYLYQNRIYDKDLEQAIEILTELHTLDPENNDIVNNFALAYHQLAIQYYKQQKLKKAEDILMEALEYTPNNTRLKNQLKEIRRILY